MFRSQCDPTVVYALELAGLYNGKLDAASLPFDSPYNTYRRSGLPPGPIANPGGASLEAALNPPETRLPLFCRQYGRRPFFQQNPRRAQSQRGALSPEAGRPARRRRGERLDVRVAAGFRSFLFTSQVEAPMSGPGPETKREAILEIAEGLGLEKFTPAEVEQIRRQLVAKLGPSGKTSADYIVQVLSAAGLRVVLSAKADTEGQYEEEFHDLLHFATLEEAEICLMRLDELWRKFRSERQTGGGGASAGSSAIGTPPGRNDCAEPARRGAQTRPEAGNPGMVPDLAGNARCFFDWLDLRKQSPGIPAPLWTGCFRGRRVAESYGEGITAWRLRRSIWARMCAPSAWNLSSRKRASQ